MNDMKRVVLLLSVAVVLLMSCEPSPGARERLEQGREKVAAKADRLRGVEATGPVKVKVLAVHPVSTTGGAAYVGTVEASATAMVASPAAGTLVQVAVRRGQRVAKGQTVLRIESQSSQSAADMARSKLAQAEDGYRRLREVAETGSVPEVKMVEVETALAQAQAADEAARSMLDKCSVTAPIAGVVEDIYVEQGVEVAPAERLLRIVDMSAVEIRFPVPENEIRLLTVGDSARVEVPAIGLSILCSVTQKGIVANPLSHSYDCVLAVPPATPEILPGMVCKVWLQRSSSTGMVVPATCVRTDTEGRYVWTVADGIVEKRRITVGGYVGDGITVSEGLAEGDQVVVEGCRKISTGMKVLTTE